MRLQQRVNRLGVRLQALMRAFEPDRLRDRLNDHASGRDVFGRDLRGRDISRHDRIVSARSMVRALLRQEGR